MKIMLRRTISSTQFRTDRLGFRVREALSNHKWKMGEIVEVEGWEGEREEEEEKQEAEEGENGQGMKEVEING